MDPETAITTPSFESYFPRPQRNDRSSLNVIQSRQLLHWRRTMMKERVCGTRQRRRWQKVRAKRQFAEVLIECDQYPMLGHCAGEDILVFTAWRVSPDPGDIMTFLSQRVTASPATFSLARNFMIPRAAGRPFQREAFRRRTSGMQGCLRV
jgi:hypothetical protein